MCESWVLEAHLLDIGTELGVATLHRVGYECPGGANEADQRCLPVSFLPEGLSEEQVSDDQRLQNETKGQNNIDVMRIDLPAR